MPKHLFLLVFTVFLSQEIEIRQLANEGVLIKKNDTSILIDALFSNVYEQFDALSESELKTLQDSAMVFPSASLILATHHHGDHYNGQLIANYMFKHKHSQFISTNDVVRNFLENNDKSEQLSERSQAILPPHGKSVKMTIAGIDLIVYRLPHGGKRWNNVESIAFMITISGYKIIHFGDADLSAETLKLALNQIKNADLVIMPYWHFLDNENKQNLVKLLSAKKYILSHIPKNNKSEIREQFQEDDSLLVFTDFNQSYSLD